MITQKYEPDFLNVKCTWKLVLLHVYEKTINDDTFTFTSIDIVKAFGCERTSAIHLINRSAVLGSYVRVTDIKGKPYHFKITSKGKSKANRLSDRQIEDDINGR